MPQLEQAAQIYASQLFWLVVAFGLIYVLIGRGMLPRITRTVDDRGARVSGDLAAAEAARASADAAERSWTAALGQSRADAQAALARAKAAAAAASEKRVRAADAELQVHLAHAEAALGRAQAAAEAQIDAVATEAAQALVQRIAGLTVERDAAAAAVVAARG